MEIVNHVFEESDLRNPNSFNIIHRFGLSLDEVVDNYFLLNDEKSLGKIKIDPFDSNASVHLFIDYSKKFASSAIVNYELSCASDLFFCLEEDTFEVLKEGGRDFYLSKAEKDLKSAYDLFNRQLDFYDKLKG